MNAFGEALNLVFMRGSGDFSSGSMPMDSISDCIPMSSYLPANESLDAFPWVQVPIPLPMDSISDCIPMSPYSPANESQTAFPWVPIPQPMNLRLHSHESLFLSQILESFGWVPPMSCHPDSGMSIGGQKNRILARFWGYPYTYHMGTPKIDCRAF